MKPGPLLAVLEEFMQGVGPSEYRRRKMEGIALGDMPLRTVKTIIQRILSEPIRLSGGLAHKMSNSILPRNGSGDLRSVVGGVWRRCGRNDSELRHTWKTEV